MYFPNAVVVIIIIIIIVVVGMSIRVGVLLVVRGSVVLLPKLVHVVVAVVHVRNRVGAYAYTFFPFFVAGVRSL